MKKTINIQNEANIKAEGKLNCHRCKPVICIETGEVFTSATDAAEKAGVHTSLISAACLGKIRTANGKHYCYLSRSTESLDAIVTRLRETSAMEEDARKWRAYQAEQEVIRKENEKRLEAERKAEEKRQREIAKLKDKIAKCEANAAKAKETWEANINAMNDAQMELEALLDTNEKNAA